MRAEVEDLEAEVENLVIVAQARGLEWVLRSNNTMKWYERFLLANQRFNLEVA